MRNFFQQYLVLTFTLVNLHCATSTRTPDKGGPSWREIRSNHFRLRTNLDSQDALLVAERLEKYRYVLFRVWPRPVDSTPKLDVVVFCNARSLRELLGPDVGGIFYYTLDNSFILTAEGLLWHSGGLPTVLAHELAHYASSFVLIRRPRWVGEGLATYLETLQLTDQDTKAIVGAPNQRMLTWLPHVTWHPLTELWEWDKNRKVGPIEDDSYYASSWLWVHYLTNKQMDRFTRFQMLLASAAEPKTAWDRAFAGISAEELGRELDRYMVGGSYSVFTLTLPRLKLDLEEMPLQVGEVYATLARVWQPREDVEGRDHFARNVQDALRVDPQNETAQVLRIRSEGDPRRQLMLARELVAARPESAQAWGALVSVLSETKEESSERMAAFERAATVAADNPAVLQSVAQEYIRLRKGEQAFAAAARARALAPWSPEVANTCAEALALMNRCAQAIEFQKQALELLHESTSQEARSRYESRLAELEKNCGR